MQIYWWIIYKSGRQDEGQSGANVLIDWPRIKNKQEEDEDGKTLYTL